MLLAVSSGLLPLAANDPQADADLHQHLVLRQLASWAYTLRLVVGRAAQRQVRAAMGCLGAPSWAVALAAGGWAGLGRAAGWRPELLARSCCWCRSRQLIGSCVYNDCALVAVQGSGTEHAMQHADGHACHGPCAPVACQCNSTARMLQQCRGAMSVGTCKLPILTRD